MKLAALLLGVGVVLGGISLALLFYADYSIAGNGRSDPGERVAWVLERGDHLHFSTHLMAGRVLDLCPCSRRAAAAQYVYARFHALTPRQKAAVTNIQPRSVGEFVAYATGPFAVGLDWIGDGIAWLGGNRPSKVVVVALDQYEVRPSEIHIARGTRVIWRNTDELGEPHTVTADPGTWLLQFDSGWLEPEEQFEITFTERGTYNYFCAAHGAPGHGGMSGTVIVD